MKNILEYLNEKLAEKEAVLADFDGKNEAVKQLETALAIAKDEVIACGDMSQNLAERDEIKGYIAELEPKPEMVEPLVEEVITDPNCPPILN
ncbi:MAG: hypothetical protein RSA24_05020 [Clostridia bacterium]